MLTIASFPFVLYKVSAMSLLERLVPLVFCYGFTSGVVLADPGVPTQVVSIEPAELSTAAELVVLDVRTPSEYEAGHLSGAVNIDVNGEDFSNRIRSLDADKTYVVHCGTNAPGGRAERALKQLQAAGFEHLRNLAGGYVAWRDQAKPDAEPTGSP